MAGRGGLAEQVSVRLDQCQMSSVLARNKPDKLDERYYGKPIRQHIKDFAGVFALLFLAITAVMLYKGSTSYTPVVLIAISAIILPIGYKYPIILYPLWKGWMAIAVALSFVMTFLLLMIMWFLFLVPTGIALKVFGKKLLDTSFGSNVPTYWEDREEKLHDFKLLQRQF